MRELYIKESKDKKSIFLMEDEQLVEYYEERPENKSIDGNIYVGKVQNVITGLDAAFVNIGEGKNGFIVKKDVLPKVDETKDYKVPSTPINKLVKPGMPLIVEVKKDKVKSKGYKVSTHIELRGRFIVLLPNSPYVTVSSKIKDEEKKQKLKEFVSSLLPENCGAIIRTNAENASKDDIEKDLNNQIEKCKKILDVEIDEFPKKIYDSGGILKKVVIDLLDYNLDKILVNNKTVAKKIENLIHEIGGKIEIEVGEKSRFTEFENNLDVLNHNKIWLKSGGFITIDLTEALTSIDVNTGKFIGKKGLEETVFKVNQEATVEICKQLRLRDIGGIVIIDFIDMKDKDDMNKILELMKEEALKDRSRLQFEGFTKLNLLELTRKQIGIR